MASSASAALNRQTGALTNVMERFTISEIFKQRPALVATSSVPGTDTYDTSDMQAALQANRDWAIAGTNAADTCVTYADGGGVLLTTTTTSGDQVILIPQSATNMSTMGTVKWNTGDSCSFSAVIKTGATFTSTIIWAGLKLTKTSVVATDDNAAFFRVSSSANSAKWTAVTSIAGTDVETVTDLVVVAATQYYLEVSIDSNRLASFYIGVNGAPPELVYTSTALASNTDLIPYIGVQTATTAAATVIARRTDLGKLYND